MQTMRRIATVTIVVLAASVVPARAADPTGEDVLKGEAAFGGWEQDKPGVRRLFTLDDLPPPASQGTANRASVVARPADARPLVPERFSVELVASGLDVPRVIRTAPNGDLFVAESGADAVRVYRVPRGSAEPSEEAVFAGGLTRPYGIAFYPPGPNPEWVYVANSDSVVRFPYRNGDLKARGRPETVVDEIPSTHHWTRDIAFTPGGDRFMLSVGSGSNVALDMSRMLPEGGLEAWTKTHPLGAAWDAEARRAVVLAFDPDGTNEKTVATGLRNCSGVTIQPATGSLWCVVNERDGLGDDTPFEYATAVKEGSFYGWPWYYLGDHEDPRLAGERPDLKGKVTVPDVLMQAHSAPLQIVFYDGDDFPVEYTGSAFVTLHGSWNRHQRTGYKVVRLLFDASGRPTGVYEDFMTGMVLSDREVWGRPVGVAVAQDGSLFVTEDGNGTIWRVTHASTASK
jgi:glucose/arabinose dehydrogenase